MLVNTTVSHVSPLLTYIPRSAWYEGTLQNDPMLLSYPNASYHATNATSDGSGASVSFSYWGAGLSVYGGYRKSLGPYEVTLDGKTTEHDGFTDGPETFAHQLFAASDLPIGQHHLRIVNIGGDPTRPVFDLDYLIFESNAGSSTVIDHSSDQCVWTPKTAGAWAVDAVSHSTTLGSGKMGMNFTGTGIAVYGELDAHSAPFSVSIDSATGSPLSPNTALTPLRNMSTLLYVKTDLLQGNHTVWVENDPESVGASATKLSISSVVVFSDVSSEGTLGNTTTPTPPASSMSPHKTVILAGAFGGLSAFLLAVLIWRLVVLYRRRTQHRADAVTARPFLTPTGPDSSNSSHSRTWSDPMSPPSSATLPTFREKAELRGSHAVVASLSFGVGGRHAPQPLRRPPSQDSSAPGYSVAATAPMSPDSPWPPESEGDREAHGRVRTRPAQKPPRRLFVASPVPSLPSVRIPPRDRSEALAEAYRDPQMPPPYRFLDLH